MEIWIPVSVNPTEVKEGIQEWLDKYSYHAYKSIIQDRINSRYPAISIPKALYIIHLEDRTVININPQSHRSVTLCPICHEEDANITQTLACNHTFHHHCIQEWFRVNNTCPMCRMSIF
jgi:hypothetical protein